MIAARTDVVIAPKQEGKGRSFSATALAYATAKGLWKGSDTDTGDVLRPVWAAFAGSEAELRAFAANLTAGRKALTRDGGFELLRTADYKITWQRHPEGAVATAYLPELFLMDPGMVDPEEAKFVLLPPRAWCESQELPTAKIAAHARRLPLIKRLNRAPENKWEMPKKGHVEPFPAERLAAMVPTAYLFAAYLDRRTRAPIPADGRFYLQFMLACLRDGLARWSGSKREYRNTEAAKFGHGGEHEFIAVGTEEIGLAEGLAFRAGHDAIEKLLAEEIEAFFQMTGGK